jgi:hypothetical protein
VYRSLTIAALLGGIIGGSLWSIVDNARHPAQAPQAAAGPEVEEEPAKPSESDEEMLRCVEALNQRMDSRDVLRNEIIVARARLAAAQLPSNTPLGESVLWQGEADAAGRYREGIMKALGPAQGRIVLSACEEFPCIFGLDIPEAVVKGFSERLAIPGVDSLFIKRLGIEDDGGVVQYLAIARAEAPELREREEAVAQRFEYRALLLDNAYRKEVKP